MLRAENLELSSHNDHLSEQVERLKKIEDKLRKDLVLSKRNEEDLKRELQEVKESRGTWLNVEAGYLADVVHGCLFDAAARYPVDVMAGYPVDLSSGILAWCSSGVPC
ncbi:hypothetical protein LWI28_026068 [Acer negundo]|uniref:Uncharacterized protein n=1 Tax=Acer negundo TaxID=4023 RepID=A0AAD5IAP0_ACENE|nr:hypothetical protein LWI28_026068 [Acer negundo]